MKPLQRSRGAASSLLRWLSFFICTSLILSAFLLAAPGGSARAQTPDGSFNWTLTVRVPAPPPGVGSSRTSGDPLQILSAALAGRLGGSGVQVRVEPDGDAYLARLNGSGGLEQLRQVVFTDLREQIRLPGSGLELQITARAARGQHMALTLDGNITTGYDWGWQELDPAQFTLSGEPQAQSTAGPFRLGAPQRITAVLEAAADGDLTARLVYRRPWLPAGSPARLEIEASSLPTALDLSDPRPAFNSSLSLAQAGPQPVDPIQPQALPARFDWRDTGKVSAVRDQGSCGSCWAFGIVGVLEGAVKVQLNGPERDLSEQFLINCNTYGDDCSGGWWSSHDFHYNRVKSPQLEPGAVTEAQLPYKAANGTCSVDYAKSYQLARWQYINYDTPDVDAIKQAILSYGPVGTAVCVGNAFSRYDSGVFSTDEDCGDAVVNHAVVLVGWDDSTQSWIMKNSWDTWWGEDGYMRIQYGTSHIGFWANYVVVQSSPPELVSPAAGAVTAQLLPELDWGEVSGAQEYQVQVSTSNAFTTPLASATVTATAYTLTTPLAPNTLYYWHVRARVGVTYTAWTAPRSLKTLPSVPVPASPAGGAAVQVLRPPLSWTQAGSASKYEVQISALPDFSALAASGSTAALTWTPSADLPRSTDLYWRARAVGTYGASAWSSPGAAFTTLDPPLPPALAAPATGTVLAPDSRPTFSWKPPSVSVPEGYHLQFSRTSAFTEILAETDVTGTSFTYPDVLPANTQVYWRAASYNGSPRMTSNYSSARSVKTLPAVPPLISPVSTGVTSLRPTLSWEAGANGPRYDVQISKLPTCASAFKSATVSVPAYTFTSDLSRLATYYWRVRGRGAYGQSAWSACRSFTTPDPPFTPSVVSPASGSTLPASAGFRPTFTWKVSGNRPDGYIVQIAPGSTFNPAKASEQVINDPAQTSLTWPDALPYGIYTWRMRAFRAGPEYSNWSAVRSLKTPAGLQGHVTSAGQPVSGVKVTISGTSLVVYTDDSGAYLFPAVSSGTRTLVFSKSGYVTLTRTGSAYAGSLRTLDAALKPLP